MDKTHNVIRWQSQDFSVKDEGEERIQGFSQQLKSTYQISQWYSPNRIPHLIQLFLLAKAKVTGQRKPRKHLARTLSKSTVHLRFAILSRVALTTNNFFYQKAINLMMSLIFVVIHWNLVEMVWHTIAPLHFCG
jgi:hypothetical protein